LACIAIALDACHKNKIMHRYLKPENLILGSDGYLYLTDFGIADIFNPNESNHAN